MLGFTRKAKTVPVAYYGSEWKTAADFEAADRAMLPTDWQDCHIVWKGVYVWDVQNVRTGQRARVEFFDSGTANVHPY